jgi:hypothetical protein
MTLGKSGEGTSELPATALSGRGQGCLGSPHFQTDPTVARSSTYVQVHLPDTTVLRATSRLWESRVSNRLDSTPAAQDLALKKSR